MASVEPSRAWGAGSDVPNLPGRQVFSDPSGQRLKWLVHAAGLFGLCVLAWLGMLIYALVGADWSGEDASVERFQTNAGIALVGHEVLRQTAVGNAVPGVAPSPLAPFSGRGLTDMGPHQYVWEIAATALTLSARQGQYPLEVQCAAVARAPELSKKLVSRGFRCMDARQPLALLTVVRAEPWMVVLGRASLLVVSSVEWLFRVGWGVALLALAYNAARRLVMVCLMLQRARRKGVPASVWQRAAGAMHNVAERCLPITVVIPAFNEEKVILGTVRSVLACEYPTAVHVVVVDDGSRDRTFEVVQRAYAGHPQVRCVKKTNGGKSSALNMGIEMAPTEIVVCIDADTQLDQRALWMLCRHLSDPSIGAVAGNPKVGNRCNLMTRIQALEYVVMDSVERQAMERANAITCVTGALGAYRRSDLLRLGGNTSDTLAEDNDLTLRLLRDGAKIVYEEDAVAWTEAPETVGDFLKQRFRWMFGTIQSTWKHRGAVFDGSSGWFGMVTMPSLMLEMALTCLLTPVVHLLLLMATVLWLFSGWTGWLMPGLADDVTRVIDWGPLAVGLMVTSLLVWLWLSAVSLRLDTRESLRSLWWLIPMQLGYHVLLGYTAYRCIGRIVSGRGLGWGSLHRTGSVQTIGRVERCADPLVQTARSGAMGK